MPQDLESNHRTPGWTSERVRVPSRYGRPDVPSPNPISAFARARVRPSPNDHSCTCETRHHAHDLRPSGRPPPPPRAGKRPPALSPSRRAPTCLSCLSPMAAQPLPPNARQRESANVRTCSNSWAYPPR
eukprot:2376443-Prymnesium_polylepis.1